MRGATGSDPHNGPTAGSRIVVVGATGNVGTSVVQALSRDPSVGSVVGLARRLPEWTCDKTAWAAADIAHDDLTDLLAGADAVIHLAWIFQPTHDATATWRNNVLGGLRVFQAAASARVPVLVHASSVGAYSPGPKDREVGEEWPTHGWPDAAYCREKAYLERALDAYELRHPEMRVVRMRPGFIFKRESACSQSRLFAGFAPPGVLATDRMAPVVPALPRLRFQALHSDDAAEAYRLAALRPVKGAFNLAAEPPIDAGVLAEILDARRLAVPAAPVRAALSAAWHLRLVPASPHLFDAVLRLPLMDTGRARSELGWTPAYTAREAIEEFLRGLHEEAGLPTAPLRPGRFRRVTAAA